VLLAVGTVCLATGTVLLAVGTVWLAAGTVLLAVGTVCLATGTVLLAVGTVCLATGTVLLAVGTAWLQTRSCTTDRKTQVGPNLEGAERRNWFVFCLWQLATEQTKGNMQFDKKQIRCYAKADRPCQVSLVDIAKWCLACASGGGG
jgi:hypothetical protein